MKKIIFCLLLASIYVVNTNSVFAQTNWNNLSPNEFIKTATDIPQNAQNVTVDSVNISYVYKKIGDKKPLFYTGKTQFGIMFYATNTTQLGVSSSTITFETGKTKPKYLYQMAVISDGQNIYFKPEQLKNKSLRNKWIKANSSQYEKIGEGLGVSALFEVFSTKSISEEKNSTTKGVLAATNSGLWQKYTDDIDDDITVPNTTRYNFEFKASAIKPFFTELTKTLTLDEAGYGLLTDKTFIKSLSNENVTRFIADYSYISVWIDNTSKKPVKIVSATWIPITEKNKTTYLLDYSETDFSKYDSAVKLNTPANSVDAVTAAIQLKIKL